MNILLAVDGSPYTKKMLAYLAAHDEMLGTSHSYTAITVQAALPPRARAVLVLYDVEGWKHEEIAAELGMAVGSSKAQLHRARHLLRERLGVHA